MAAVMLPETLEDARLSDLLDGETAWTVPWAMHVDVDRRCWLITTMQADDRQVGTATMKVTRRAGGFVVDLADCAGQTWRPQPQLCVVGATAADLQPVIALRQRQP